MSVLEIKGISKRFGNRQILDNLSLEVPEHSIYGFIGKNGAGKTTTMKLVLGLYQADSGEIFVNGESVTYGQNKTNKYIGYLPDVPEFYNYMTPEEYLKLCADITGIPAGEAKKRIPEMLEMVGLDKEKKRIQGFSRGMKQRLGIAQALLPGPKLLICDEPTSALDPVGRKEILDILKTISGKTTVIFSTHILPDVERICDHIGILHGGNLAWEGDMEQVRTKNRKQGFEIEFVTMEDKNCFVRKWSRINEDSKVQIDKVQEIVSDATQYSENHVSTGATDSVEIISKKSNPKIENIMDVSEHSTIFICEQGSESEMRTAMEVIIANNIPVKKIEMREPTLESVFMEVMEQ